MGVDNANASRLIVNGKYGYWYPEKCASLYPFWKNLSWGTCCFQHISYNLNRHHSTWAPLKFRVKQKYGRCVINQYLESPWVNRSFTARIRGLFWSAPTAVAHISTSRQASPEECLHLLQHQGDFRCVLLCWMQPCDKIREGHRVTALETQAKEEHAW